jgi:adsorption protein B
MRTYSSSRIYGWRFASLAPLRVFWGNLVNFQAAAKALSEFTGARIRRQTVRWQKTEHPFPTHPVKARGRPRLGEVLVRMHCLNTDDVQNAMRSLPRGSRLGEHLVHMRKVTEENLYLALSSQAGIPLGAPEARDVNRMATRMLPADMTKRWRVLPYRVDMGQLHLATTEVPSEKMARALAGVSALHLRFRLVAPREFAKLVEMAQGELARG